jgi:type II secretory ATPase GspE/PulE/Tfp pilus assembly ATPase PilB-like protein
MRRLGRHTSRTSTTADAGGAPALVTAILAHALARRASDVHVEPTAEGCEIRYRVDGLLETGERYDAAVGRSIVTRLMVLAQLLTYRLDVPQEGRLSVSPSDGGKPLDLRLAVMPTTHGLRAAVRLPADLLQPRQLPELGLPESVLAGLHRFADADAGMLLLTGPAGSGKTTTIYALLAHIAQRRPGLSIVSLEDPVERDLAGITQIEVSPFGELTYERSLRSILRQDPQVLMLGEIRDAATASLAVQAAMSGHRLISTLHAATPAGAIARLLEMGLEPYQLTSALFGVVAQRLLRRSDGAGGYRGRVPVAEMVVMNESLRAGVLARADAEQLSRAYAGQAGFVPMRRAADELMKQGATDLPEIERVLGPA